MIFRVKNNKLYLIPHKKNEKAYLKRVNNKFNTYIQLDFSQLPPKSFFFKVSKGETEYPVKNNSGETLFYIEVDKERELIQRKKDAYKTLQKTFANKWLGIQIIAIGREWSTYKDYVESQINSYKSLAEQAKLILENNPDDELAKTIVARNNEALHLTFQLNLMLQKIRGIIEDLIETDIDKAEELLGIAQSIKLKKSDLTPEKLNEIMTKFIGETSNDNE